MVSIGSPSLGGGLPDSELKFFWYRSFASGSIGVDRGAYDASQGLGEASKRDEESLKTLLQVKNLHRRKVEGLRGCAHKEV